MDRTEIVNLALMDVGVSPSVLAWDEDSTEAHYARTAWGQAVEEALSSHAWLFAKKGAMLERSLALPDTRSGYAYELPADYVRLGAISDNASMYPPLRDYTIANVDGRAMIVADSESVFIEYVFNAPEIGRWPRHFGTVVAAYLAVPLSNALKTIRQDLDKLVQQRVARAKSLDSHALPPRQPPLTGWQRAKFGGRI